jgi:dephospho-CoA kinase
VTSLHRRWLLTGGIGSGKSEVRRLLERAGIRTIDADSVGHAVLRDEAFQAVSERWPDAVVDGAIDRSRLAGIVFADPQELAALEAMTHPLIFGRIEAELEASAGVAVVEMPLIDAAPGWPRIVVDVTDETRIRRAVARGMSRDEVLRRIASQPSRAEWLASGDLIIPNHGSLEELGTAAAILGAYLMVAG